MKLLSLKGEACHRGKGSKDKLTVLLCCNMDGWEKLKRWAIGKYQNPRCLKNTCLLPCHYRSDSLAWMTYYLFEEFLQYFDNEMRSQCRSVLFPDNCAAHPRDLQFLWNVEFVFFPSYTTSHLLPLDAGVIKNLKHSYRKCIVKRCLVCIDHGQQPTIISVLDVMHYVASVWTAMNASTVQHCFARCGFRVDGEVEIAMEHEESEAASSDQEQIEAIHVLGATGVTYDYVAVDAAVVTLECKSITKIVANLVTSEATECNDDDEHEPQDFRELADPSFGEAVAALDLLRRYVTPQTMLTTMRPRSAKNCRPS